MAGERGQQSDRLSELEQRVDQLEWRRRAGDRSRAVFDSVVPQETRDRLRAAGREQLLAVRSFVDHWIARLDDRGTETSSPGREDIKID